MSVHGKDFRRLPPWPTGCIASCHDTFASQYEGHIQPCILSIQRTGKSNDIMQFIKGMEWWDWRLTSVISWLGGAIVASSGRSAKHSGIHRNSLWFGTSELQLLVFTGDATSEFICGRNSKSFTKGKHEPSWEGAERGFLKIYMVHYGKLAESTKRKAPVRGQLAKPPSPLKQVYKNKSSLRHSEVVLFHKTDP